MSDINIQRMTMEPNVTFSQAKSLADAEIIFADRICYLDGDSRPAIVVGYDRNRDAIICIEIMEDGSAQLIVADTAEISGDSPSECVTLDSVTS
ncbi:MAG: hypothetical protein ACRYGG_18250, partial [Janthinobacterium lividum]